MVGTSGQTKRLSIRTRRSKLQLNCRIDMRVRQAGALHLEHVMAHVKANVGRGQIVGARAESDVEGGKHFSGIVCANSWKPPERMLLRRHGATQLYGTAPTSNQTSTLACLRFV